MENPTNYTVTEVTTPFQPSTTADTANNAQVDGPWVESSHRDALDEAFAQIPLKQYQLNNKLMVGYLFDDNQFDHLVGELSRAPRVRNFISAKVPASELEDVRADSLEGFCSFVYEKELSPGLYFIDYKGAKLNTMFYSIVVRKIANYYRLKREKEVSFDSLGNSWISDPFEAVIAAEPLTALPEDNRQALLLRYHCGLGVDEVAAVMGRTYRGAESLLSRSRMQLKRACLVE